MLCRLVDVVVAGVLLIVLAPVLALISILIRRDSRGPALYAPAVVGQYGRLFPLLRFRTMHTVDGDAPPDVRLTRVGRVLRDGSLDHLPMLVNLLIGDLTLVGPRPMERGVVDLTDPTWRAYVQVKPGVINHAVVVLGQAWTPSRVSRPTLNQELELAYAARRTVWVDVRLVARAIRALVASRGNVKARKPPDPRALG